MADLSIMIKPASGNCNMRCAYCFYFDEVTNREFGQLSFMDRECVDNLVLKVFKEADSATFVFQGGEPTLWGLSNFRYFIEKVRLENIRNIPVSYSIQTNGTLFDEKWRDFLRLNNFLVGVSFDGPPDIHDKYRKFADGTNTAKAIKEQILKLRKAEVETNILITVNKDVAQNIERVYKYLKKLGVNYHQYIPCIDPIGEGGKVSYSLSERDFANYLKKLFTLWKKDILSGEYVYIRYFENLINILAGLRPEQCGLFGRCTEQYVIEANGDVYPCDFYVLDGFKIGNIIDDSLEKIDRRREDIRFIEESDMIASDCDSCKYYKLCKGGCRRERDNFNGSLSKNRLCSGFIEFFKFALPDLQNIAKRASEGKLIFKNG